ncbi:MAG: hypothetical protein R3E50_14770 [Halioglobus sp.]
MQYRYFFAGTALLCLSLLPAAQAAYAGDEVAAMRAELDALKAQYEARIESLEQRLQAAEKQIAADGQPVGKPPSGTGRRRQSTRCATAARGIPTAPAGRSAFRRW